MNFELNVRGPLNLKVEINDDIVVNQDENPITLSLLPIGGLDLKSDSLEDLFKQLDSILRVRLDEAIAHGKAKFEAKSQAASKVSQMLGVCHDVVNSK